MRFIITCMVIVGLSLFAIPLIPAFNGIQKEREAIMASAANAPNIAVPPPVAQTMPDTLMAADMDAAAGADMTVTPGTLTGGFTGEAPRAFGDMPTAAPVETPQDAAQ